MSQLVILGHPTQDNGTRLFSSRKGRMLSNCSRVIQHKGATQRTRFDGMVVLHSTGTARDKRRDLGSGVQQ